MKFSACLLNLNHYDAYQHANMEFVSSKTDNGIQYSKFILCWQNV